MPTAAIIIIGNEILSGKYRDENSPWMAVRLRALGCDLRWMVTIPDEVDLIARCVREAAERFDWVFTSGGVGPTHDDLTMEGVARAFGVGLHLHPRLEGPLRARMKDRITPAALRMAQVPAGAELWEHPDSRFPQVVMRNVVIFPGVPALLRRKFDAAADRFGGTPVHSERLTSTESESQIAATLSEAQGRWPTVEIGSYPRFETKPYTVIVTMDSRDPGALAACLAFLRDALSDSLVEEASAS